MMKGIRIVVTSLAIWLMIFISAQVTQAASSVTLCPGVGAGYWAVLGVSHKFCATDYFTWNTTSYAGEESQISSSAHYILCGYSSMADPGNVSSKVYIPWSDGSQTHHAHYYKWASSSSYLAIGSIDQYNSYSWNSLYTVDWNAADVFKVSDWTSGESKYSKHVDVDGIYLSCP